ncbi:YidB family protein [Kitasatospora sp. NPDC051853]|uniref:YidB family protein n=1 Tax=Kitasatospora sp. NPDC051853 TaxID=3364058 RepID=UPI0037A84C7F
MLPHRTRKNRGTAMTDLGKLLSGLLGGSGGGNGSAGNLLSILLGSLAANGAGRGNGLGALLQQLTEGGLGSQARSWVGTGDNHPVTGPELAAALPPGELEMLARNAGITPDQAADTLATHLPTTVDRLTPNGELPTPATIEELFGKMH